MSEQEPPNQEPPNHEPIEQGSMKRESVEQEPEVQEPQEQEPEVQEPQEQEPMEQSESKNGSPSDEGSKRNQLLRRIVAFQLKLMADGLRDLVLLPVSLVAALVGYVRGGDEPERELDQVMEYGRQTEEWIDLFEQRCGDEHSASRNAHSLASIDAVFDKVEESLRQSYMSGDTSKDVQSEIDEALDKAHKKARNSTEESGGVG